MATNVRLSPWTVVIAFVSAFALMVAGIFAAAPARADSGDFKFSITAPASIPVYESFSYAVTIDADVAAGSATGIVLTATLPAGIRFSSVPTGGTSPVASVTAANVPDSQPQTVTFALTELKEQLSSFVFSVTQNNDRDKYLGMPLTTTLTGSAGPSGTPEARSATTSITGDLASAPTKTATTLLGSDNRTVAYKFQATDTTQPPYSHTFWLHKMTFTDIIPAGARIVYGSETVPTDAPGQPLGSWAFAPQR